MSESGSLWGGVAIPIDDPDNKEKNKKPEKDSVNLSIYTNGIISSRKEFKPLKPYLDLKVDWKSEKVTFYTNSTTYKFDALESDSRLMGISI